MWLLQYSLMIIVCVPLLAYADQTQINLSPQAVSAIKPIYQLIDDHKLAEAEDKLENLLEKLSEESKEWAFVQQMAGYVAFDQGNYHDAVNHFRKALTQKNFPKSLQTTTTLDYGQALLQLGRRREAAEALSSIKNIAKLPVQAQVSLAHAFLETEKPQQALTILQRVWQVDTSSYPSQWYKIYAAVLDALERQKDLSTLMSEYRRRWPGDKEGWIYGARAAGKTSEAFSLYSSAYELDLLQDEALLLYISTLALEAGVPVEGARILERALATQQVKLTSKSIRLLSDLYSAAKDIDAAIVALERTFEEEDVAVLKQRRNELRRYKTYWQEARVLP